MFYNEPDSQIATDAQTLKVRFPLVRGSITLIGSSDVIYSRSDCTRN